MLSVAAGFLLLLPPAYMFRAERHGAKDDPLPALTQYLKALYSRDFKQAYRFISSVDQRLKPERVYVRERGPFTGFALDVARKLSEFIEFTPVQINRDETRARITLGFKVPDMNSLGPLLLDWDEERLDALSANEQRKLIAAIDDLRQRGELKLIEGKEEFIMAQEGDAWRLVFDWSSGVRVVFASVVPQGKMIEAKPTIKETVVQPEELFTVQYRVKNMTDKELFTRISHHVEPAALAPHLDLVECALLLPVRIPPGEEQSYSSTYVVRPDLPDGTKRFNVTYEFKLER